jgi:hypothetical protein
VIIRGSTAHPDLRPRSLARRGPTVVRVTARPQREGARRAERRGCQVRMTPAVDRHTAYPLGTRRGLDACASVRGTFAVLALDHRQNLRKEAHPRLLRLPPTTRWSGSSAR